MSNTSNDLLMEDLKLQFDEATLIGDIAGATRVIDTLKRMGLPYKALADELVVTKAQLEDRQQDWDDPFTAFRYA